MCTFHIYAFQPCAKKIDWEEWSQSVRREGVMLPPPDQMVLLTIAEPQVTSIFHWQIDGFPTGSGDRVEQVTGVE
jgi:hypothetical protein